MIEAGLELRELQDHLNRLYRISKLAWKFESEGLNRKELAELAGIVKETIIHSTGRRDLPILDFLEWLSEVSQYLLEPISLRRLREILGLRRDIRVIPLLRSIRTEIRKVLALLASIAALPKPPPLLPLPEEMVDEFDAILRGFSSELRRHIEVLKQLIQYAPILIESMAKADPGQLRGTLGEALCIWWVSRVLHEVEDDLWRYAKGPLRLLGIEVDILAARPVRNALVISIAEIKNSKPYSMDFKSSPGQLVRKVIGILSLGPRVRDALRQMHFPVPREVIELKAGRLSIITLNKLSTSQKEELSTDIIAELDRANLPFFEDVSKSIRIYDGNDILKTLNHWKYKEKSRYLKMFRVLTELMPHA